MLERLFGNDDENRDRDLNAAGLDDRELRIRERMEAQGITEEEARRIVLSEEELAVGTREVSAGEVGVSKRVETRRVEESVPLRHDEVEIERRPVSGYDAAGATIGTDEEIRVPLHAEEAVVEKRVVPKEELVIRKQEVTENQTVHADLRTERAEVHREGEVRETDRMEAERLERDRDGLS